MTSDPTRPFGRVLTAMVTPLTEDGVIDLAGAQELAAHLVDRQAPTAWSWFGTTGESPTSATPSSTPCARWSWTPSATGRVVAGVGTNDTAHSVELARAAERPACTACWWSRRTTTSRPRPACSRHFTAVADAADLPVMLYDIPGRTGVAIAADTLARAAEEGGSSRSRTPPVTWPPAPARARSELASTGATTREPPLLALGAVGVVSVAAHLVGQRPSRNGGGPYESGDTAGRPAAGTWRTWSCSKGHLFATSRARSCSRRA